MPSPAHAVAMPPKKGLRKRRSSTVDRAAGGIATPPPSATTTAAAAIARMAAPKPPEPEHSAWPVRKRNATAKKMPAAPQPTIEPVVATPLRIHLTSPNPRPCLRLTDPKLELIVRTHCYAHVSRLSVYLRSSTHPWSHRRWLQVQIATKRVSLRGGVC